MLRVIKISLAAFVALFCLFYAIQNIMNLQAAHGFVSYVASMADHEAYPKHFGPAITASWLTWFMLFIIVSLELAAGLLAGRGFIDMLKARKGSADEFNSSKR